MVFIVPTANFYLTNAGKAAALDATNNSINIEVTKIALGTAKYDAQVTAPTQTALTTEVGRYNLVGGGSSGQVLRLTTTLTPNYTAEIFEIGLFLSDGTLFAVAAVTGTDPLMQTANGLTSVITLGCSLADVGSNVTVSVDANSPIAVVLMNQHIENSDPHPQYLQSADISGKADKVTTITAGAGLTGGGDLSVNRTVTLGTPSTITSGSGNKVSGSTHTHELGDGSVTDAKITNVSASKITGIIPSANLPPASAPVNVIDNLTSVSTTSALSANQGRVLAEQLASKFNSTGGTITGPTTINSGENSISLNMDGVLHIGYQLLFKRRSTSETEFNIGSDNTSVVMIAYDRKLIFEAKDYTYFDSEGGWFQHTANAGKEKYNFHTDCNVFEFNKDVYFGSVQKAANGYTTLPNGLIMQWGRGQITNDGDVAFPIAFPNSLVNVQVTNDGGGVGSHGYNRSLSDNTKFRCIAQSGETLNFSYIALGY